MVTATDYAFALPADLKPAKGQSLEIKLQNAGKHRHELELFAPDGKAIGEVEPIDAGATGAATFEFATPGTYRLVCGVDDHEARGMVSTVVVQ